ncbi:MAG: Nif3-like dinuclear metal center hexameric protein [Candidatus Aenigmarchaeota archaeon]|nr:Nif3-like dinuclear metal center hexameric protein [Candidatus Aenigmarchaeota archaeon]
MQRDKIIENLEQLAPPILTDMDNIGLIVDGKNEIEVIGVTLDFSMNAIKKAIEKKCDLLIVHHGPEFKEDKENEYIKKKLQLAKENDLSVFRMHLNLDFVKNGLMDSFCKLIGLKGRPEIVVYKNTKIKGGVYLAKDNLTLDDLIEGIKHLNPKSIRIAGVKKGVYRKIAVTTGAGFIPEFLDQLKPDVFISGELTQEAIRTAEDLGITLIEVTHYLESKALEIFSNKLKGILPLKIEFIDLGDSLEVVK